MRLLPARVFCAWTASTSAHASSRSSFPFTPGRLAVWNQVARVLGASSPDLARKVTEASIRSALSLVPDDRARVSSKGVAKCCAGASAVHASRALWTPREASEVVLVDAKGDDSGFGFSGSEQIASDTRARHAPTSQTASQPFSCRHVLMQSADTRLPQTKQGPRRPTRSLVFPVTPRTRSWNEFSALIEEWEALLRLAA